MNAPALDFYAWLRTQFSDLDSAKEWARQWIDDGQEPLPDWGEFSSRAMAFHISRALEGASCSSAGGLTNYLETVYGSDLYFAMWGMR